MCVDRSFGRFPGNVFSQEILGVCQIANGDYRFRLEDCQTYAGIFVLWWIIREIVLWKSGWNAKDRRKIQSEDAKVHQRGETDLKVTNKNGWIDLN